MVINTNKWNRIRYTIYVPIYDRVARYFSVSRKKSIDSLQVKSGDKVLIIGAGTGLDLEFLPTNCKIVATDITPAMVARIKRRNNEFNHQLEAFVMDGQKMTFVDESFDHVILHLILAVIPNPIKCIHEAERLVKKNGNIAVFDKFVPKGKRVSVKRKIAGFFMNILATNLTRDFESMLKETNLELKIDQKAEWKGNFRRILLRKVH